MISGVAVRDELNNQDTNCGDEEHVNVAALMQNKLADQPNYHQYRKGNSHLITFQRTLKELCDSRWPAMIWHDWEASRW